MEKFLQKIWSIASKKSRKRHSDQQCEALIAKYHGTENLEERARVLLRSDVFGANVEAAGELANLGELMCFSEGSTIITKDGVDNDVYVLLQGTATVERGKSGPIARVAPITIGELAALTPGKPRSATVWVEKGQVVALKISAREFVEFLRKFPEVEERLNADIKSRFYQLLDHVFTIEAKLKRRDSPIFWLLGGLCMLSSTILVFIGTQAYTQFPWSISLLTALIVGAIVGLVFLRFDPRYRYQRLLGVLMGSWILVSVLPNFSGSVNGTNFGILAEIPPLGLEGHIVYCIFAIGLFWLICRKEG